MSQPITRRETLRKGLTAASLLAMGEWNIPALAADEEDVPFTDIPSVFAPGSNTAAARILDIRRIDGLITPKEQFFAIQHIDRPAVDGAAYRLRFTGMVKKPAEFSLSDLRTMRSTELVAGYECSGNSPRTVQGLCSNGRWTGVPLSELLKKVGVEPQAREVVFFGTDHKKDDVVFRQQTLKLDQQFGRSITLENAMKPDPLVAWALNGDPLTREQGFPARLIMPGWYGVANVKWLAEVHLQEDRYLGNYQARWYRNIVGAGGTGEDDDPNVQWVENEVTRLQLKSVIARVKRTGGGLQVVGFVLNDGTPLRSVEVQVDGGAWQKATLDPSNTKYSWKLFTWRWDGATPGEHTLVSRVTDMNGAVQPTEKELFRKKTFLEDNGQFPRKVMVG